MRPYSLRLLALPWLLLLCATTPAAADQPSDWVLGIRPEGTVVNLDVVVPGVQAAVEHRKRFYGTANELTLRSELTAAYPLTELRFDADLRILVLTLGVSAGVRDTYTNLQLGDAPLRSRVARGNASSDANEGNSLWGWGEVRGRLSLPVNDYFLFDSINTFRREGRDRTTFDYRRGVVHDGQFFRSTTWLYAHHRDWGAIAPIFEVVNYRVAGARRNLVNLGLALLLRPGFVRRNDIALIQFIANTSSQHYGTHFVDLPIVTSIGYRIVLDLPDTAIDEDAPSYFDSL